MRHILLLTTFVAAIGLFAAHADAANLQLIRSFEFSNDGHSPIGGVILDGATLYGTTSIGGVTGNNGTIFAVNTDGSGYHVLHTFAGTAVDGAFPNAGLTRIGSKLYGTTVGPPGGGSIFSIDTDGTGFQQLHSFSTTVPSANSPFGSLIASGTTLYGTAQTGGTGGGGTVFRIDSDGTGYQTLRNFGTGDGTFPTAGLTLIGSTLFGTTSSGGASGVGTVFRIETDGSGYQSLHSFNLADGFNIQAGVVSDGSVLYGTAVGGGTGLGGVVYRLDSDGGNFQVLHEFSSAAGNGIQPYGGLALAGSRLYGTTWSSGQYGNGTVFSLNIDGTNFQVLEAFGANPLDPVGPRGDLLLSGSTLFGTTTAGGSQNQGTAFAITVPEPASALMLGIGALVLLHLCRSSRSMPAGPRSTRHD